MFKDIKVIGFDADDTLWVNEPFFREAEEEFCGLLKQYNSTEHIKQKLFETEINNLELYGYGAKGFILSLIETAINISEGKLTASTTNKIINIGKQLMDKPLELLDSVEESLKYLCSKSYKLIVATKGDLKDQERKLKKSNLIKYFHHIEVMSDKQSDNYRSLLSHLEINPEQFLMIGNSMRSDILPCLEIGSKAIHIPFQITWLHESVDKHIESDKLSTLNSIEELPKYL